MGRASDSKERLISAAGQLVYSRSYQGVGVEELCEHSGVKKGSFYHFFASKRELALAALDSQWSLAKDLLVSPAFRHDVPPLARIGRFFDAVAAASAHEKEATGQVGGCRFGNLSAEMGSQEPQVREKVQSVFDSIASLFEESLAEAIASGEMQDADPETCAKALLAYMEGILLLGRTYDDPELMRRLGQRAIGLAIGGHSTSVRSLPQRDNRKS